MLKIKYHFLYLKFILVFEHETLLGIIICHSVSCTICPRPRGNKAHYSVQMATGNEHNVFQLANRKFLNDIIIMIITSSHTFYTDIYNFRELLFSREDFRNKVE